MLNAAQTEVGQYIADPAATSTVLVLPASSPNAADYTIKVRSEVTGENLSTPFPLSTVSVPLQTLLPAVPVTLNPEKH